MLTIALLAVFISLALIFYTYFPKNSFNYWQSRNIPCLKPKAPFGNLEGVGEKYHVSYVIKKIYDEFKGRGLKLCGSYFFTRPIAIILDLDLAKDILVKDFNSFVDRNLYYNKKDDPLGANLATLDGLDWKKLRTKLTPTFTSGKLKFMFPTIVKVSERLRDCLGDAVDNEEYLEMKDFLTRFSADVVGSCAFGIECNSLKDPHSEFITMGRLALENPRHSTRFLALITSFPKIARMLCIKNVRDDVSKFFTKVVRETIEYRDKTNITCNDFMEILLNLRNANSKDAADGITFNEIAAQTYTFFVNGFETISSTLTYCLFELAKNPDVQMRARSAIKTALKKNDGQFTYEMLMDIPYINQIIQETLRKYPTGATVNRIAKTEYPIKGTDIVIEKGTWIKVPVCAIHRDAEYYPEPEKFDPERFSSSEVMKRHPMTWLPFGDGPRGCIAIRLAMLEMQIALVTLLSSFEFLTCSRTVESIKIHPKRALMIPNDGIYLKLHSVHTFSNARSGKFFSLVA